MTRPWPFSSAVTDEAIATAAHAFAEAMPFAHVVLDGWFDEAALQEVSALFERESTWQRYEDGKQATSAVQDQPFFQALQSPAVTALLEQITGDAVVPDPTLRGGGLHRVARGGRLGIHVDFNRHPTLPLLRKTNTILYLNQRWEPHWRGALTLTDRKGSFRDVSPQWNRWAIFRYSADAWHGHPDPLACPEGIERRSAAVYYYQPLDGEIAFTGTNYA